MNKTYFDLETTGTNVNSDRIVQIGIKVVNNKECLFKQSLLINPGISIPKEASDVHGITDKHVKNALPFSSVAKELKPYFEDNIIIGFNILKFDLPLLYNEFERCGISVNFSKKIIDVYKIETKASPKTLGATYKKYFGKEMDDAHDAMGDVIATQKILKCQKAFIEASGQNIYELSESTNLLDFDGKLIKNDKGQICFNFGTNKDKHIKDCLSYCEWMLKSDFSNQTKNIIRKYLKK